MSKSTEGTRETVVIETGRGDISLANRDLKPPEPTECRNCGISVRDQDRCWGCGGNPL